MIDNPWINNIVGLLPSRLVPMAEQTARAIVEVKPASADSQFRNIPKLQVVDGVAIIGISGGIQKNRTFLMDYFGTGTATREVEALIKEALGRKDVASILLYVDSPGGTVDGSFELADTLASLRGKKPMVAFTDGMATSAAYLLAASTDDIFASSETAQLGSIGVYLAHVDMSKMNENFGIKVTEITAGKYKAVGSPASTLTDENRQVLQDKVDSIHTMFIDRVAAWRGLKTDAESLSQWAEAQVYFAKDAQAIGLINGIMSLDAVMTKLKTASPKKQEGTRMQTIDDLKAAHPDLYKAVVDVGRQEAQTALAADRLRVSALMQVRGAAANPQVLQDAIMQGMDVTSFKAAMFDAEEKTMDAIKAKAQGSLPEPVGATPPPMTPPKAASTEEELKAQWESDPSLRAKFGGQFSLCLAHFKATKGGNR